jgi:hypothetical protein
MAVFTLFAATPVFAQATYHYVGNPFTLFSCGVNSTNDATVDCTTPAPTNPFTSYTAPDHVEATLVLDNPLPANLAYGDIRTFAGFSLTMTDGHQTVTNLVAVGMFAEVSTDASGNILDWRFVINTGGTNNGGVATYTAPFGFKADQGTLKCCDPVPGGDLALNQNVPGVWTFGSAAPTPEDLTSNLITLIHDPLLQLTTGQVNSFTDKLNNALASIEAGANKQARNQLNSFITAVQNEVKKGKMSAATGQKLIDAARDIIALL